MGTYHLATSRAPRNPVRVQQWNASIRAGDDFKLAVTVYADQLGTPQDVMNSRSLLVLAAERDRTGQHCWGYDGGCGWDYGLGWLTLAGGTPVTAAGYVVAGPSGRLNFAVPSATTATMCRGRYRISIQVDLADGEYSQVEGILQVRDGVCQYDQLHTVLPYFQLDVTPLDTAPIVPANYDGVALDADGFPEIQQSFASVDDTSSVLGTATLGQMVLGGGGSGSAVTPPLNALLGADGAQLLSPIDGAPLLWS